MAHQRAVMVNGNSIKHGHRGGPLARRVMKKAKALMKEMEGNMRENEKPVSKKPVSKKPTPSPIDDRDKILDNIMIERRKNCKGKKKDPCKRKKDCKWELGKGCGAKDVWKLEGGGPRGDQLQYARDDKGNRIPLN